MLRILLEAARADLAWALDQAERTQSAEWQREAANHRENVEVLEAMLKVPA